MTTVTTPEKKLTAHDLAAAIKQRYEPPEWHIESEVTLESRRLDVVAFNLWGAKRAYNVVGFEIKVSRGDWMRELDQFQKSERWMEVVDAFYVVTPPKLVRDEELPKGWGLLELCGSRMMTRAHAARREPTLTLPRELCARFIGRMAESVRHAERNAEGRATTALREQLRKSVEVQSANNIELMTSELESLRAERKEIYAALGLEQYDWMKHSKTLRAASLVAELRHSSELPVNQLIQEVERLERQCASRRDQVARVKALLQEGAAV